MQLTLNSARLSFSILRCLPQLISSQLLTALLMSRRLNSYHFFHLGLSQLLSLAFSQLMSRHLMSAQPFPPLNLHFFSKSFHIF